ncbi:hypothetical protein CXG81DRAFT_21480, partial [Caulochytrium protostelioides]
DGPDADVDTVADAGRATDGADGAGRPRVVVSVSTFAGRVQDANATIASLLDQDYILDAIYLHVPPAIERLNISGTLTESDSAVLKFWDGRVSVRRPVDLGPTTKLIGALYAERDPDTIVITVDGDVVSRPGMSRALSGTCGRPTAAVPDLAGWPLGCLGAAYRVGWFDISFVDFTQVPTGCRLHDDVYIGPWLWAHRGIRPYVVEKNSIFHHGKHTALSINQVAETEESYQIPCLKHFNYLLDKPAVDTLPLPHEAKR